MGRGYRRRNHEEIALPKTGEQTPIKWKGHEPPKPPLFLFASSPHRLPPVITKTRFLVPSISLTINPTFSEPKPLFNLHLLIFPADPSCHLPRGCLQALEFQTCLPNFYSCCRNALSCTSRRRTLSRLSSLLSPFYPFARAKAPYHTRHALQQFCHSSTLGDHGAGIFAVFVT